MTEDDLMIVMNTWKMIYIDFWSTYICKRNVNDMKGEQRNGKVQSDF